MARDSVFSPLGVDVENDEIVDGTIQEAKLHTDVQAKLNTNGAGNICIPLYFGVTAVQGTWAAGVSATYITCAWFKNTTSAQNDECNMPIFLDAGTYTLKVMGNIHTMRGIMEFKIDGVQIALLDFYNGSSVINAPLEETGIVIAAAGLKVLTMKTGTKNGSSSGYGVEMTPYLYLERTT